MTELALEDVIDERAEDEHFLYHRSALLSSRIHRLELEHIFRHCWLYLGHESEVPEPGDFRRRTIARHPVFFVRSRITGEVRAFANTCPHRGATICRMDSGSAKTFQCFYHAWTFDTDGVLIGVPDEESYGGCWDKADHGLKAVPRLESYRGFLFINFDPDAEDLVTYLAGAAEYIDNLVDASAIASAMLAEGTSNGNRNSSNSLEVLAGTHQYGIKANWKLLVENSMDGYHLAPTHQTYFQFLKESGAKMEPSTGTMRLLGNGHAVIEYSGAWGRPVAKWSPQFGEEARPQLDAIRDRLVDELGERGQRMAELNRNLFIYPNMFLMDNNAVAIRTIQPTEPGLSGRGSIRTGAAGRTCRRASGEARELCDLCRAGWFRDP